MNTDQKQMAWAFQNKRRTFFNKEGATREPIRVHTKAELKFEMHKRKYPQLYNKAE